METAGAVAVTIGHAAPAGQTRGAGAATGAHAITCAHICAICCGTALFGVVVVEQALSVSTAVRAVARATLGATLRCSET